MENNDNGEADNRGEYPGFIENGPPCSGPWFVVAAMAPEDEIKDKDKDKNDDLRQPRA